MQNSKILTFVVVFNTNLSTTLQTGYVGFQKICKPLCIFLVALLPNPSLWLLKVSYSTEFLLTFFGVGIDFQNHKL